MTASPTDRTPEATPTSASASPSPNPSRSGSGTSGDAEHPDQLSHQRRRAVSDTPVEVDLPRPAPRREKLAGRTVSMDPLDSDEHAADLFPLLHGDDERERVWDYLPYGPYASPQQFAEELRSREASTDPLWFALRTLRRGRVEGLATIMEVQAGSGVAEIGHVCLSSALQNSVEATEGLYLLMRHVLTDLGYRRLEWKCNALNTGSRRAAGRLGFSFEGIFFQHRVAKGRNRDTAWFSILDADWPAIEATFQAWLDPSNFDETGRQIASLGTMNRALP